VPLLDQLDVLLTHGLVHLLGYDHETEEEHAVMAAREEGILARLRLTGDGNVGGSCGSSGGTATAPLADQSTGELQ
jgi:hypothetical protein